jgi:5-methylcytosine-specific restriction endonuclease McrA
MVNFLELPIEPPHICSHTWRSDLAWEVGLTEKEIRNIARILRQGDDILLRCEKCSIPLQYSEDDFYVDSEFFGDYFDISASRRKKPSRQTKREIARLYGHKCYGCGKKLSKVDITNDHIIARFHGGETSPLNLQVLCKKCNNNVKGSRKVDTINVHLTFLFRPPPSDSFEGVIW